MTDLVLDVLGRPVGLSVPPSLVAELHRDLVDLPATPATPLRDLTLRADDRGDLTLHDGIELVLDHIDPTIAIAALVWRLNAIVAASPDHVVLHAGCVAGPRGGIVMPGPSGAGKTHLTRALVDAGYGYLSDEHAAVSAHDGLLAPFPKPLDLGTGLAAASAVRAGSTAGPSAPQAVVLPRFRSGGATALVALSAAEALLALCGQCPSLEAAGEAAFLVLADLASRPVAYCTYGDTADAVVAIESWLASAPPGRPARRVEPLVPVTTTTTTVMADDELVVFDHVTGSVHQLNRSAGLVWLCAAGATGPDDVAALAVAETPPGALDPADARATVEHLCELGLLSFVTGPGAPRPT